MLAGFLTVFLLVLVLMGTGIYAFTNRILEARSQQSYTKILDASEEILNDKLDSYAGMARMLLGSADVQKVLPMNDYAKGTFMDATRWNMLEHVGRDFIYNMEDVTGLYIFDNEGKLYYQDPGRTTGEVAADIRYADIVKSAWYRAAVKAKGKETYVGDDVLGNSGHVISCVKVLNSLDTQKKIGLLVVRISKDDMRNVIGQFPTDGDIYALENQGKLVYESGYSSGSFSDSLKDILKNTTGKYLVTRHRCEMPGWTILHAVPANALFPEAPALRLIILVAGLLATALTILSCVLQSKAITAPLEQLKSDIQRVGKGKRHFHSTYSNDEIGAIGTEFQNMVTKQLELKEKVAKEELLRKDSELQLLQSQINPHFLYNTLDTLYWMAIEAGADQVADLTQSLSEIFKISLSEGQEFIPVRDEIRFVEDYLHIQNVRFEDKFLVKILVDEEILDIRIVKQILQPFVENAIYHGLEPKLEKGRITITGKKEGEYLIFTVSDDGVGIADGVDVMKGYAVSNVYERIRLHYGPKADLRFESSPGKGTTVRILLPLSELSQEGAGAVPDTSGSKG